MKKEFRSQPNSPLESRPELGHRMIGKAAEIAADGDGPSGEGIIAVEEYDLARGIHFGKGLAESRTDLAHENHRSAAETVGIENRIRPP